jgi:hypothetical protein
MKQFRVSTRWTHPVRLLTPNVLPRTEFPQTRELSIYAIHGFFFATASSRGTKEELTFSLVA